MNIEYIQSYSIPSHNNLLVSFTEPTKNVLRTYIGTFMAWGTRVDMDDAWTYQVPVNPDTRMCIVGSLVQHRQTGEWSVFVDEWHDDGEDSLYVFDRTSPYKLFSHLFIFNLQQGQADLDDVTVKVFAIVPPVKGAPNATSDSGEG